MDRRERKRLGAWYTPHGLVGEVVSRVVGPDTVTVLDPACGDGRFLEAAGRAIEAAGRRPRLVGVDIDDGAVDRARAALAPWDATVRLGDALTHDFAGERFDAVVGNPPFLSQMSTATTRGRASAWGGGPYADAAVEFLSLAAHLTRTGGRFGLVLPQSVLASRDAAAVRLEVTHKGALRWLWWSQTPIFDAHVRTCALVVTIDDGAVRPATEFVELSEGLEFASRPNEPIPSDGRWSALLARGLGVPRVPDALRTDGMLGDRAAAHLDFRDEYYGIVPAVVDDGAESHHPPLVTSGLIDPGGCAWGARPVRFAKATYAAPRVILDRLAPEMQRWAERRLVPKVVVASQTRVIEAAVDATGAWLPGVPVVSLVPRELPRVVTGGCSEPRQIGEGALWSIAAMLTSPVASAWLAEQSAGAALSTQALRITPAALSSLPWPAGDLGEAGARLAGGDISGCAHAVCAAYGLSDDAASGLMAWWEASRPRRTR